MLTIRSARPDDFLTIAALDRVAWLDAQHGEFIPDGEHVWRVWTEHALVFVAEMKDDATHEKIICGAILAFPCGAGHYCLHKVFVAPEGRGRGVGSQLFNTLLAALDERVADAFLTVAPENTAALRLYKKYGFMDRELVRGYYRPEEDRFILWRRARPQ